MEKITSEAKAKDLVNMYYQYAKTQHQAILMAENAVLGTLCDKIDDVYRITVEYGDMDEKLTKPCLTVLRWWAEVANHLHKMK